jgi:FkbM family methyltransferase
MTATAGVVSFVRHERRIRFSIDRPDDHIQRQIVAKRDFYEASMLGAVAHLLRPGGLVVDVGANIGNHTVFFAAVLDQQVIAVEPNPAALTALRANVELNGLEQKVEVIAVAAGASAGRGTVMDIDSGNLGRASVRTDAQGSVDVATVDGLVGDRHVDLLKVDVEGMECDVLQGARGTIERCRPVLLVEAANLTALRSVESLLRPAGYRKVSVHNDTPTWLFMHAVRSTTKSVLDRISPEVMSRLPATRSVVAGMATVGGNEDALRGAVVSLLPQVDRLYVWVNRADRVPEFLSEYPKVVSFLDRDGIRYGDAGKFWGLQNEHDLVYLACDDDILYPADFVARMIEHLADIKGMGAVGVHGALLLQPGRGYYVDGSRSVFHFSQALARRRRVNVVATQACAFHDAYVRPAMDTFEHPNMADIWFARYLQRASLPAYVVPRPLGWLRSLEVTRPSIYEESRTGTGSAYDSSRRQDAALETMWPVSVLQASNAAGIAHLVLANDPESLSEVLLALKASSSAFEARAFFVICQEANHAFRDAGLRPELREEVHLLDRNCRQIDSYLRLLQRPNLRLSGWRLDGEDLSAADPQVLLREWVGAACGAECPTPA